MTLEVAVEFDAEMARLDRQLAARVARDRKVGLTIAAGQRWAAALIARRHGYELHVDRVAEPGSLWAEFWPVGGGAGSPGGAVTGEWRRPVVS